MRCEAAQLTLSARMDGAATASEAASAEAHATTCPRCSAFFNGVWRIREGARFEVAQPVPDLVPEIMRQVRSEPRRTKVVAFRRRMDPPASRARTRRAVAVALVAGFVLGVVMSAGGLIPRKEVADRALAEDIPADLRQ